ncbi:MAG: sulfatase-like hydrolase/transferase [Cyanobacteria bacterium]|nr:sulfatase-like hydrolase/transferase [Cyanobacteriota bacterium]MDA1020346.1 sulfatase-like hydrolase/transferase [Cyanobacteriota bacterium]
MKKTFFYLFSLGFILSLPSLAQGATALEQYNYNDSKWFASDKAEAVANEILLEQEQLDSLDHNVIVNQIIFLARIYNADPRKQYRKSINNALDLILDDPIETSCLSNRISILTKINGEAEFGFLDELYQQKVKAAFDQAIDFILQTQLKRDEQYLGWSNQCQKIVSKKPVLSTRETVELIKILESINEPGKVLIARLQAAKLWLEESTISGYLWNQETGKLIKDESQKHLWARFYRVKNNDPVFIDELGELHSKPTKLALEQRLDQQWYGNWACGLVACDEKPNVLFIVLDDLNDMIKLLDPSVLTQTPHLDHLATKSTLFTQAYTSATQCNPSRFSVLTGLNPDSHKVYDNNVNSHEYENQQKFLMDYFRDYGYKTIGLKKIFHGTQNIPWVWDEYYPLEGNSREPPNSSIVQWGHEEADIRTGDTEAAIKAAEILTEEFTEPTFMAVGFSSPHLPWHFPKQFFDLYPLADIKTPEQPFYDLYDVPEAGTVLAELFLAGAWEGYHEKIVEAGKWKEALQAYMAGISKVDDDLGRVLQALYNGPNAANTIVVLWSDHGLHLGEKEHWKKHALWEKTTHVPLMIAKAGQSNGQVSSEVVSLLDIYPTLIDMANLPKRSSLQGISLKPLIDKSAKAWPGKALTTMGAGNYSIREGSWRYIRYQDRSEELYDHKFDPHEFYNLSHLKQLDPIKAKFVEMIPILD